jgi:hypothetical protein
MIQLRLTGTASLPWEGSLEELMECQRDQLPEHTARRIEGLRVGEKLTLDFADNFTVERTS